MQKRLLIIPLLLPIVSAVHAHADVITIPGDYATIQAGIMMAEEGDTVMVSDGIYEGPGNRDIDFLGKAVVVTSENGPLSCTIDFAGGDCAFSFHSDEDSSSILSGFTLTGGIECWQAVRCDSASPLISGNLITGNGCEGMFFRNGAMPQVVGNEIEGNSSQGIICYPGSYPSVRNNLIAENGGSGIYLSHASAFVEGNTMQGNGRGIYGSDVGSCVIVDNAILENDAGSEGGGIWLVGGFSLIQGNGIEGNSSQGGGGGIFLSQHSATVLGNRISGNSATGTGGGVYCAFSTVAVIEENIVTGNSAASGGGIYAGGSGVSHVGKNLIAGNTASNLGGGLFLGPSTSTLSGNTICGNQAERGGAAYCNAHSSWSLMNSIVWGNSAVIADEIYLSDSATLEVSYSDVRGGWEGAGNIDLPPLFALPEKSDLRLLWGSPCIDTGHPDSLDADGSRSDMGAFPFDQDDYLTVYVTTDTTDISPGDQFGVTFTCINRWGWPQTFWAVAEVTLPRGAVGTILEPARYTLPAHHTVRAHVDHAIPPAAPPGVYEYRVELGLPPQLVFDADAFCFLVTGEPGISSEPDGVARKSPSVSRQKEPHEGG